MSIKTLTLFCLIPVALLANGMNVASHSEPLIESEQSSLAKDAIASDVEKLNLTDIENNQIPNSESPAKIAAEETEANETEEVAAESPDDSSEGTEESEEADAELAADMAAADSATMDSVRKLTLDMTTAFVPTFSRRISAPYGIRTYRMHRGVDLGLCHGEDRTIVAAFPGKVVKVRNQGRRKGYGKYVIMDHGNGLTTLYAHLASWNVKVGDELQAGDTLGIGGNTGRSFGAHLHFEMKFNGIYIDPATVFNFAESTFQTTLAEITQDQLQSVEDEYQKELSKHRYYKVRRGDCLGKIARRYGISVSRLKKLNGLRGNNIRPGQVLRCS